MRKLAKIENRVEKIYETFPGTKKTIVYCM